MTRRALVLLALSGAACGGASVEAPAEVDGPAVDEPTATPLTRPDWTWADSTVAESHPRALPPTIDVSHYDIAIRLHDDSRVFEGHVDTHARVLAESECISLHAGEDLEIPAASRRSADSVASTPLEFTREGDVLEVCFGELVSADAEVILRVEFRGTAGERDHYGLFTTQSAVSELPSFYTQFESQGARLALPLHDEPYDKATTTVELTGHLAYTLLSNGERIGCASEIPGTQTCTFVNTDPISTYLITFVAAELESIEADYEREDGSTVPMTVYTEPGFVADGLYAMYALDRSLSIFEQTFGLPYPWTDYGIVALPGFRYGGMENKGLTNINAAALYVGFDRPMDRRYAAFGIVAHELAHEWFGNLVTMQWWDDVWLNEGFASYMTGLATMEEFDWVDRRLGDYASLQRWYMDVERGPFAHPIVYDDWTTPEQLFDAISYTKGRKVLDMLEHMIGQETLFAGIRTYLEQNAGSNAATARFFETVEATAGQDLSGFVEPWLFHAGFPEVTVAADWDEDTGIYRVVLQQQSSRGADDPTVWSFPIRIAVEGDDFSEDEWIVVVEATHELTYELTSEPTSLSINRGGIALIDLQIDGWGWQEWARQASNDSSPYGRGVAIFEMLDLVQAQYEADPDSVHRHLQEIAAPIAAAIEGDNEAVRRFAIGRVGDSDSPEALRRLLAAELLGPLTALVRSDAGDNLLGVQSRRAALGVLGYVDQVTTQALLREMAESRIDYLTPSVAGLMRTSAEDRFDVHASSLARATGDQRMVSDLISVLAGTEDAAKFPILLGYLHDELICTPLDHGIPRRMLRGVLTTPELAYSDDGLAFMLAVFTHELDRPGTIIRAVRSMQDASERPDEEQQRLRTMLEELESRVVDAGDPAGASEVVRMLRDSLVE